MKIRNDVIFKQWLWSHYMFYKIWKILTPQYNHTKFYDCWKSNARVRLGAFFASSLPYEIGSQNTPYKLGLTPCFCWLGHFLPAFKPNTNPIRQWLIKLILWSYMALKGRASTREDQYIYCLRPNNKQSLNNNQIHKVITFLSIKNKNDCWTYVRSNLYRLWKFYPQPLRSSSS